MDELLRGDWLQQFHHDRRAFIAAVDWDEPWLLALLAMHVVLFAWILLQRKDAYKLAWTATGIVTASLLAHPLNQLLAQHWRKFSRQDYFQEDGLFLAVVYSFPLVLQLVLVVVLLLKETVALLVQVKRKQWMLERKKSAKKMK